MQPGLIDAQLSRLSNGLGCTCVGAGVAEEFELQDRSSRLGGRPLWKCLTLQTNALEKVWHLVVLATFRGVW